MSEQSFATKIGLNSDWPNATENQEEVNISGLLSWANGFIWAAERLHVASEGQRLNPVYAGPTVQNAGLAAELTLKALLRGAGKSEEEVRKFGHNTYKAYFAAREFFDEVKFLRLHFANTAHLKTPEEVKRRLKKTADEDPDIRWRTYFDHLRILDTTYNRPFRSRYVTPGPVLLPETEILLVGTKILLAAMEERARKI